MKLYQSIQQRVPIDKGWSGDRKYCVTTTDGGKYLLRIAPSERYERKKQEFERMTQVAALDIPMCRPLEFGVCGEGVYTILTWINGTDAEECIAALPEDKQYAYGLDAGRILRRIHSLPAPENVPQWEPRFNAKIDRKLAMYDSCPLKYEHGEALIRYLAENRHLLADRPQTYQHGDYHIGNMMVDHLDQLVIIDFEKDDYGDPWEEFNRIVWSAQAAPRFAAGMVDGYFDGNVPEKFWRLLALYICSNTLGSLPWAIPFGEVEIQVMRNQAAQVLSWYDNMTNVIPNWYLTR